MHAARATSFDLQITGTSKPISLTDNFALELPRMIPDGSSWQENCVAVATAVAVLTLIPLLLAALTQTALPRS